MTGDPTNLSRNPDPPGESRIEELDRPLLSYMPAVGTGWKNWRLEGAGFSPLMIYAALFGLVGLWVLGACLLSLLGPIAMLLLGGGLFALTAYLSKRAACGKHARAWGFVLSAATTFEPPKASAPNAASLCLMRSSEGVELLSASGRTGRSGVHNPDATARRRARPPDHFEPSSACD